jgi:hypothetical protein
LRSGGDLRARRGDGRRSDVLVDEVRAFRAQGFLARHEDLVVARART